ncbi:hypothetical protein FACS1894207_3590 [Bacteroidia bacterium]|nr:hypothetical protein FACS1894207_3590 [Bacteroidia bacterium]
MDLKDIKKIETREQYEAVRRRVDELICEATANGALDNPESDNKYTREIGRLSYLGAVYENESIQFKHLNVRKKSPLFPVGNGNAVIDHILNVSTVFR